MADELLAACKSALGMIARLTPMGDANSELGPVLAAVADEADAVRAQLRAAIDGAETRAEAGAASPDAAGPTAVRSTRCPKCSARWRGDPEVRGMPPPNPIRYQSARVRNPTGTTTDEECLLESCYCCGYTVRRPLWDLKSDYLWE